MASPLVGQIVRIGRSSFCRRTDCRFFSKTISLMGIHYSGEKEKLVKRPRPSASMLRWTDRQLKDPYVRQRDFDDYRARSAYKLIEIDDRYGLLRPGMVLVDCGAAPGSWTQVLTRRAPATRSNGGQIISVDILLMEPLEGATVLDNSDFTSTETREKIMQILQGRTVDGILSDMSPNVTGVHNVDHERIVQMAYGALAFAVKCMDRNLRSFFLCKLFDGSQNAKFFTDVKKFFRKVSFVKPDACRDESSEIYILAREFRGIEKEN